jgi:hypothetical protein
MKTVTILSTLLCVLGVGPAAFGAPGLAQMEGRVLDDRHRPFLAAHTWVKAFTKAGAVADQAPVDETGHYILLVEPGEYLVRVSVDGEDFQGEQVTLAVEPLKKDLFVSSRANKAEQSRQARHRPQKAAMRPDHMS